MPGDLGAACAPATGPQASVAAQRPAGPCSFGGCGWGRSGTFRTGPVHSVPSEPAERSRPGGPARGSFVVGEGGQFSPGGSSSARSGVVRWAPAMCRGCFSAWRPCPALPSEVRPRGMQPPLFGLKPARSCLPWRAPSPVLAAPAHLAPLHKPLFPYRHLHRVVLGCGISVAGTLYSGKFPNHRGSRRFLCFNSGSLGTKNSSGRAQSWRSPAFQEENDSAAHSEGSVCDSVRFCIRPRPGRTRVCLPSDEWTLSWTCVGGAGWGLVSPGRGPPPSEPQHARLGGGLALRGTDRWMELGETSHTRRFRAEWGLHPGAPDRGQHPQTSLLQVRTVSP